MMKTVKRLSKKIKPYLTLVLRKIPLSHQILGIPKRRISISETLDYFLNQNNQIAFYHRLGSEEIKLQPAVYLNSYSSNCINASYLNEEFIISLPKGKYCSIHQSVITKEGFQLAIASNNSQVSQREHPIFHKLILPRIRKYKGVGVVLTTPNDYNYYHCLFQIAPKIWFLKNNGYEANDLTFFLLEVSNLNFQKEIVAILGIDTAKIINLERHKYIEMEQMVITPTFTRPEPWICLKLRQEFLFNDDNNNFSKKIFISRNKAKFRRLLQEKELVLLLKKFGFSVINTENFSIKEQALIFNKARIIIGAHGAGLSNLVFCEPGSVVLELRAENHQNILGTVYEHLSSICNLKHYTYLCQEVSNEWGNKPNFSDLEFDVDNFECYINKILGEEIEGINSLKN